MKLLTTDWLVLEPGGGRDRKRRDLARVRQVYIPELIMRLHTALISARARMPEYVLLSSSPSFNLSFEVSRSHTATQERQARTRARQRRRGLAVSAL